VSTLFAAQKIKVRDALVELKINPVKTLLVLLAACALLLASQRPAQAQVSWGIPLPFPFLFYNFNQGPVSWGIPLPFPFSFYNFN
jgi:hypothetical protein